MQVPIKELSPLEITSVVFEALRGGEGFQADVVDAFLGVIDWRAADEAPSETVAMLNSLKEAADRYEQGELSLASYRDRCVGLFFPDRRRISGSRSPREPHLDN